MWGLPGRDDADGRFANTVGRSSNDHPTHIGRFRLEDQVLGSHGKKLWRAYDELLSRMVALRLVEPNDPLHDDLRAAACAAARVVDRSVVQVLDVLDFDGTLVIVTEWVDAIPLEQLLTTALTTEQSIEVTRRVAEAIGHIHAAGITHGRIRPACVMIDTDGEVRLRGHMIDARIYGIDPGSDPAAADIAGLGAIMTACLTGRWPGETPTALPTVPIVAGKRAVPSQLRADLPPRLDSFVIRCLAAVPGPTTLPASNAFTDAPSALKTLAGAYEGPSTLGHLDRHGSPRAAQTQHPPLKSTARKFVKRTSLVVAAVVAIFAVGFVGARFFPPSQDTNTAAVAEPAVADIEGPARKVAGALAATSGIPAGEQILPITAAMTLSPVGKRPIGGGAANAVVDDDPATAWKTARFNKSTVSSGRASGIVVDLGEVRQVKVVNVGLVGNNSGVELRIAERLGKDAMDYQLLQKIKGASTNITMREARPIATRYLLVLLTSVPKSSGKQFQGGISSIQIRG
ncbi:MAG: protein kinase family protein [Candidatus Nanopelagicales bacterium]